MQSRSTGALAAVLLHTDVAADAYSNLAYAPAPTLPAEKNAIASLRSTYLSARLEVQKLTAPPSAHAAMKSWLSANGSVISALDEVVKQPSFDAMHPLVDSRLTPQLHKLRAAEKVFRQSLGLPNDPWLQAKPKGKLIYSDSLSTPHGRTKWVMGGNVRYAGGGLSITAQPGGWGGTGPSTSYNFDARHITAEVDAKPGAGAAYYGIACPGSMNANDGQFVGQLGPGGKWLLGLFHQHGRSALLTTPATNSAIKVGQVNHLRVDCDQFTTGIATARLYVNGTFLGAASAPIEINPRFEPGLVVISASPSTPSTAQFANWSVSKLPAA